jgi:hypothetical protein
MRLGMVVAIVMLAMFAAVAQQQSSGVPFSVELTAQEGALVMGLLDQTIKQGGYQSARQVSPIMDKMIAASQKAQAAAVAAEFEKTKADEAKKP